MPALLTKILGGLAFAFIYQFYYGGGDTFNFYFAGRLLRDAFADDVSLGIKVLFLDAGQYTADTVQYTWRTRFFGYEEEWFFTRFTGLVNLLCLNSYVATNMFFGLFVFFGNWKLYEAFVQVYPKLYRPLGFAAFFAPSLVFWGSGLIKDTVTLASLGFLTYSAFAVLQKGKSKILHLAIMLLAGWLILSLKAYILYTLLPCLLLWYYLQLQASIPNVLLKALAMPVLLLMVAGLAWGLITSVAAQTSKYSSVDDITQRVQDFHWDHTMRAGGSVYNLGEIEYTPAGIVRKIPASINVALFRPYLWEVQNVVMLMAAGESLLYLLLTVAVFFRTGFGFRAGIFSNRYTLMSLSFALVMAFVVGFVSFNFGALARFKIPLLPFYGFAIVLMLTHQQRKKEEEEEEEEASEETSGRLSHGQMAHWAN